VEEIEKGIEGGEVCNLKLKISNLKTIFKV
jgi:hypothetical protein